MHYGVILTTMAMTLLNYGDRIAQITGGLGEGAPTEFAAFPPELMISSLFYNPQV